jgi:dihydroorotase
MHSLLITGARVFVDGRLIDTDLIVDRHGRIARIGDCRHLPADEVVDGTGRLLLPGVIDDQVHFREPGLEHKGTIADESAAAVLGGITTYFEMPNTKPATLDQAAIEAKHAIATRNSAANWSFYLGASNDNLDAILACDPALICGVKVFMGASTGNMLVDNPQVLAGIFGGARTLVATHCEDTPTIALAEAAAKARWGEAVPWAEHARIRGRECCLKSSTLAVELARQHGTRLHVLHLTTADELVHFQPGPVAGKRITGEACIHHLWFSETDYERLGARLKCNPAVKAASDRAALRRAVAEGRLDIIATDHAPHTAEEKSRSYFQAPAGLPLAQHFLPALLDLVAEGVFDLPTALAACTSRVADLFGIVDRGRLVEGAWADLVLVDPQGGTAASDATARSKCRWTPFHGHRFRARIDLTVVSGRIAQRDGRVVEGVRGHRVDFRR